MVKSYVQGLLGPLDEEHLRKMQDAARRLIAQAHTDLESEGVPSADRRLIVQADLRFQRQSFELTVPAATLAEASPSQLLPGLAGAFHREHERAYGYTNHDEAIHVVAVRVRAEGRIVRSYRPQTVSGAGKPTPVQTLKTRFATGIEETPVYRRDQLPAGAEIPGPAIIVEPHATTVIPPGDICSVAPAGALLIDLSKQL